jgi:diguanylate cyclase (GGDEF)-like protein
MADASFYEACWNELLKASRAWQLQPNVQQLLIHVCRTSQELLAFDQATAFLLERTGISEIACWPQLPTSDGISAQRRLDVATHVIQSGRSAFIQHTKSKRPSTILCSPLTASREIMGALYVETANPDRMLTDKDQQLLEMFALQAASCLEHTRLYQSAITDPLTGLYCHRHFQQEVEQAVRRSVRSERPVSLLLMDLDHFKALNDTCGHDVGNQCLLQVASILRSSFRSTDMLARFGGDEFEILLPDTGADDVLKVAEKAREKIAAIEFEHNRRVTATMGIASFPANAMDAQALFLATDSSLYAAKEAGRDRVICSTAKADAAKVIVNPDRAESLTMAARGGIESHAPSAPSSAAAGNVETIDGHVVLKRLGIGSTGEILLVLQPGLDREVALKRPLTPHLTFAQTQSFEQEAKVTAGLNHPGVVPVFNIGRDHDSRRYYTMKPLSGPSLAEIIDARRKGDMDVLHAYSPGRLLEILHRVSETIAYAHERGVLHLDLNPDNILVGKFGEITVIDWATGASSPNRSGEHGSNSELKLVGSPAYVAPELIRGGVKHNSPACDVFSLGTLLYYLLTDQLPFQRATTAASIDALLKGELIPPDISAPEAGLDPVLSALCVETLALEPAQRPSAHLFAERLGLSIRHEMEWSTIRFGPGDHPIIESEWTAEEGKWRLDHDHWASDGVGMLCWNNPVPGSFRFSCEAWVDKVGAEISLFGHRPAPGSSNYQYAGGYFFQLGAEFNAVVKLARHKADVLVKSSLQLEPGRRYRLELEYQDESGLVHCAIDGKRVFTYRELFPFPGSMLGFYSYGSGAHFRPLELRRQNWNLQIPALRAADGHYQHSHYAEALERYLDIARHVPKRIVGLEATLKAGLCLAALGRRDEARRTIRGLAGTMFEPFALAEEAKLEIGNNPDAQPARALELFNALFERFPESQARASVFDGADHIALIPRCFSGSRSKDIDIQIKLNRLGVASFDPPADSQMRCQSRIAVMQCSLAQYQEGLREHLAFGQRLSSRQRTTHFHYLGALALLALATGREDLLPDNFYDDAVNGPVDFYSSLLVHIVVRKNEMETSIQHYMESSNQPELFALLIFLSQKDMAAASKVFTKLLLGARKHNDLSEYFKLGSILIDAGSAELFENLNKAYADLWSADDTSPKEVRRLFNARRTLESGNVEAAIAPLSGFVPVITYEFNRPIYLLQILLSSLGLLKNPTLQELREKHEQILSGTMLDLAKMFLGEREPHPNELWPHPLWRPEWRLWLGIWLEAKGRKREAHEVVAPSRDPRYGLTHCQPAIDALLTRTSV